MALTCSSSSPYTQDAVPYFVRSAALPSIVIARSFDPSGELR
jgi:hypothetical protein